MPGPSREKYDAIVAGAGTGGLVAAAYLAQAGKRVLVLDQHYVAGGNATVFHRVKKYEFDVGIHYIGDCGEDGVIPRILQGLGLGDQIEFNELDPDGFDVFKFPDFAFRTPKGIDRYRDRLAEHFPKEKRAIDRYCKIVSGLWNEMARVSVPPKGWGALLFPLKAPTITRWSSATMDQVFDSLKMSRELRAVLFGFSGIHAVAPSRCSAMLHMVALMHYLKGAYYPKGGGQVISDALADKIRKHDGEICLKRRVERIVVEDGRAVGVVTDKGERPRADLVVSNADLKKTLLELVGPEHLPEKYVRRVEGFKMSLPLFVAYCATTLDLRNFGLGANNIHILPTYDFERVYAEADAGRFTKEKWLYVTAASLKDPTNPRLAPPGEQNFQIMTVCPAQHETWRVRSWKDHKSPAYKEVKERFLEEMLEATERVLIPGLRASLRWREAATPISHERFVLSSGGTSYGIEASASQFGMHRPGYKSALPGLYLCGASTVAGHGIVGAMSGGLGAASAILGGGLTGRVLRGEKIA